MSSQIGKCPVYVWLCHNVSSTCLIVSINVPYMSSGDVHKQRLHYNFCLFQDSDLEYECLLMSEVSTLKWSGFLLSFIVNDTYQVLLLSPIRQQWHKTEWSDTLLSPLWRQLPIVGTPSECVIKSPVMDTPFKSDINSSVVGTPLTSTARNGDTIRVWHQHPCGGDTIQVWHQLTIWGSRELPMVLTPFRCDIYSPWSRHHASVTSTPPSGTPFKCDSWTAAFTDTDNLLLH